MAEPGPIRDFNPVEFPATMADNEETLRVGQSAAPKMIVEIQYHAV
jgi:hypothetical protein